MRLQRLHVGRDLGRIEPEQWLPLLHHLPIAYQDLADDTAAHRLHGFALARDDDGALHRDALIERRQAGPGEETAGADDRQHPAQACKKVRVTLGAFGDVVVFHAGFTDLAHTPEILVEGWYCRLMLSPPGACAVFSRGCS
ncbi:hypothetical protein D3C84_945010 [compost metagenome]